MDFDYLRNAYRPTFEKEYYGTEGKYRVDYKGIIDTILTDCNVLRTIENGLKNSVRNDMFNQVNNNDARMSMIIVYDDNRRDTLLSNSFGFIYTRNKEEGYWGGSDLCYIIQKNIGYYSWRSKYPPKSYKDSGFSYLSELDTLNRRDSIKVWLENNPKVQGATLDYW